MNHQEAVLIKENKMLRLKLSAAETLADKSEQLEKKSACGYNYVRQEFLDALAAYRDLKGT